jgi:cbb3-type cytochrome oxidase subunit 3
MIQNILRHLGGIEHYGVLSLCLFCTVFVGVLVWAFLQRKSHLDYMARVALDTDSNETSQASKSHE